MWKTRASCIPLVPLCDALATCAWRFGCGAHRVLFPTLSAPFARTRFCLEHAAAAAAAAVAASPRTHAMRLVEHIKGLAAKAPAGAEVNFLDGIMASVFDAVRIMRRRSLMPPPNDALCVLCCVALAPRRRRRPHSALPKLRILAAFRVSGGQSSRVARRCRKTTRLLLCGALLQAADVLFNVQFNSLVNPLENQALKVREGMGGEPGAQGTGKVQGERQECQALKVREVWGQAREKSRRRRRRRRSKEERCSFVLVPAHRLSSPPPPCTRRRRLAFPVARAIGGSGITPAACCGCCIVHC